MFFLFITAPINFNLSRTKNIYLCSKKMEKRLTRMRPERLTLRNQPILGFF